MQVATDDRVDDNAPDSSHQPPQPQPPGSRGASLDAHDLVAAPRSQQSDLQDQSRDHSSVKTEALRSSVPTPKLMPHERLFSCFSPGDTTGAEDTNAESASNSKAGAPVATSPLGVRSSRACSSVSSRENHMHGASLRVNLGQGTDTTSSTMHGTTSSLQQGADLGNASTWAPERAHVTRNATGVTCHLEDLKR